MTEKKKFSLVLFLAAFVLTISSCRSISTSTYTVETPSLKEESVITIVLVSDLHSNIYGKDQTPLIDLIKQQNPDLILLSGDIFDCMRGVHTPPRRGVKRGMNSETNTLPKQPYPAVPSGTSAAGLVDDIVPMTGTQLLLSGISGIAPIYYVTGNHEYESLNIQKIREELENFGVIILSDDYVKIEIKNNEIILAGIEDPEKKLYETPGYDQDSVMENKFRELDEIPVYKILLAHRPERIVFYRSFSFDLILSGHTHGGQVRIPGIINGLYAPDQGLFPKYGGGIYKHDNTVHIISRGLSINRPRVPRIFNPPELVVIDLFNNSVSY